MKFHFRASAQKSKKNNKKNPGMSVVAGKGMRFTEREYEREMWVEYENEIEGGNGGRKRRACMHDWCLR